MRDGLSWAMRFPNRCGATLSALWRFTTQGDFIPSDSSSKTSDGTTRIELVIGATVAVVN